MKCFICNRANWSRDVMAVGWDKSRRDFVTVPSVLELLGLSDKDI
jgi:hypothetical protein